MNNLSPEFPAGFLWGAATAAHQIEGNNLNSDWWALEHAERTHVEEPSGDGVDSYHRWGEDMDLLAAAGLTDYRFSIEWARIEPAPGEFSAAAINHYRAMVDGAVERGIRPLITLHHFTAPRWFAERGGWLAPDAGSLFCRYVDAVAPVIGSDVDRVCTMNEPLLITVFHAVREHGRDAFSNGMPAPHPGLAAALIAAHRAAVATIRAAHPHVEVGWSIACQAYQPAPGTDCDAYMYEREGQFVEAAIGDDWVGVQAYTRNRLNVIDGEVRAIRAADGVERTLTGWEYYPPAVGEAVRQVSAATGGMPIVVTENGIATDDDARRIDYTTGALDSLRSAMADGVDLRGYLHWSLLDNYEWGSYRPTFGLIAVDRQTFHRTPKPSLAWLGSLGPTRKEHP